MFRLLKALWCRIVGHKMTHAGALEQPIVCLDPATGGQKTILMKYDLECCKSCHIMAAVYKSTEDITEQDPPSRANWWGAGEMH